MTAGDSTRTTGTRVPVDCKKTTDICTGAQVTLLYEENRVTVRRQQVTVQDVIVLGQLVTKTTCDYTLQGNKNRLIVR